MTLKKILFVHPFLLHYHYPRLAALAQECQKAGISLHNIQLAGTIKTYDSLIDRLPANFDTRCLFPGQDLFKIPARVMRASVKKVLEDVRPDVVFLYGYSLGIMRWIKFWAERNKVASVVISDSNYTDRIRYWPFEVLKSLFISRLDAAFVGGKSSSLYLQGLGLPDARIVAGYDVVDNAAIQSINKDNKKNILQIRQRWDLPERYFLFVGRMVKCKNVSGLLRSFEVYVRSVEFHPWDLVLCGDGPDEMEFRELANSFPEQVKEHIQFRGLVKQPELIDFFSGASCLILPSTKYESWGLVVNEALVCGLPVIISNRCGCAMDLVADDVNGWQFNPEDTNELTMRMLQMHYLAREARLDMGRRGEEIIAPWGLDRFCSSTLECAQIALDHLHS